MQLGMESWFSNFSQLSRSWNSPETLADIPRPYLEYAVWGLFKGAEVVCYINHVKLNALIAQILFEFQGRFLLAGIFAGPPLALSYAYSVGLDEMEMKQKCYEIRCDTDGMTIDRCAFVWGFVGWYWKRFQGAVDGINLGVAYAIFNNKVLSQYTSPLLRDKVLPEERYENVEAAMENKSKLVKFMAEENRKFRQITGTSDNSKQ
uniref:ADP,ATP carrier protein n=1 Tax=Heterorhabditis bacteriophora TaxID=37862 RepID=A0A1I7X143_HETBA